MFDREATAAERKEKENRTWAWWAEMMKSLQSWSSSWRYQMWKKRGIKTERN